MLDNKTFQSNPALETPKPDGLPLGPMIGSGGERHVYHWQDRAPLLAKIMRASPYIHGKPAKGRLERLLRRRCSVLEAEQRVWLRIIRQYPQMRRAPPVAELRGVTVRHGTMIQLAAQVSDAQGNLAPTLKSLFAQGQLDDAALARLSYFGQELLAWNIPVHDLQPGNIMVDTSGPEPRFVAVDGYGETKNISLRYYFAKYNAPHTHDHLTACARMIGCRWDEKSRCFLR